MYKWKRSRFGWWQPFYIFYSPLCGYVFLFDLDSVLYCLIMLWSQKYMKKCAFFTPTNIPLGLLCFFLLQALVPCWRRVRLDLGYLDLQNSKTWSSNAANGYYCFSVCCSFSFPFFCTSKQILLNSCMRLWNLVVFYTQHAFPHLSVRLTLKIYALGPLSFKYFTIK